MKLKDKILAIGAFIMSLIGLVFYFKNKAEDSETRAILGETKGQDKELKAQQDEVKKKIKEVKEQDDSVLTPEQRAKRWDT